MIKHSLLLTALLAPTLSFAADAPPRLKRAESFLGVHFDFHAGPDCREIGKNTTPEMVERMIDLVGPDYLQIDCKGHPGLSSYPTKAGNRAPGFVGDPLRVWREATARRGVALYMHYSGVWDSEAIRKNPSWGAINSDGSTNGNAISLFSPYADRLLVPQLRELAGDYKVDGAWIDGECWASVPDYPPPALDAFRDATGIQTVPRKPGDPHWTEFLNFHREQFRKYLRHYIAEVKRTHPEFQLCSNWAYTDHMAEPVSAPVDFISGDYSPEDSVNSARLSGRYLVRQGKPWDLMAWSFTRNRMPEGRNQKSAEQLKQEAAVVLALGGGFQAYFQQRRDGSIQEEYLPIMAQVAKFCRERQALCHRSEPVPQVALLLSTAGHYRSINGLFNRDLGHVSGTLQALLENQESVEVLGEHHLAGRMREYPLIVIPEWDYLEPSFVDELLAYAREGGSLLVIGAGPAKLLREPLRLQELVSTPKGASSGNVKHGGETAAARHPHIGLAGANVIPFGQLAFAESSGPAASIIPHHRGKIGFIHFSLGETYPLTRSTIVRGVLRDITRELFPAPLVRVTGTADVDLVVSRKAGKLLLHLVNTAGPHRETQQPIFERVPAVGPLGVSVRQEAKPAKVTLEPGAQPVSFEHNNGRLTFSISRLDTHRIVVIE